ncbi:aminotransferase class IV [Luteolibacter sp. AS25]|uniref:aminotransferase class IV n=1 Tax=Luteolibacter sp. AS25 TaxID=3135776 RepID=UPI00398AF7F3
MGIVWHDGVFLDEEDFRVSPKDRGLCHGLSLFETILAVNGRPRLLGEHLKRLNYGLDRLGVRSVEVSVGGLDVAMTSLLKHNELSSGLARIRFTVSLGDGALNEIDSGAAWAWMTASRVGSMGGAVKMTVAPWKRDTQSVLRGLKIGSYAEHLIATDLARREGFDEILFYNSSGELCEAAMANIFLIKGKQILTPSLDSGCLPGVTRAEVIRISKVLGITCVEKPLSPKDVAKVDGMFLTSSIKGPVWVAAFDGKFFEQHDFFQRIREEWQDVMTGDI